MKKEEILKVVRSNEGTVLSFPDRGPWGNNRYRGNNKAYVTQDTGEYFAESFCDYTENPSVLKQQRPKTYNYINNMVNSISDNDITAFRNTYEWIWNLK